MFSEIVFIGLFITPTSKVGINFQEGVLYLKLTLDNRQIEYRCKDFPQKCFSIIHDGLSSPTFRVGFERSIGIVSCLGLV